MPRILYNEGRVVGYSAYEEYVRQALQQDPDSTPATEKEWLSSTISIGSSMLLHIEPDEANSLIRDFKLPETSRLFAANTIIGSFFEGTGHNSSTSSWCDYVESYGNLISNTSDSHPTTDATTYPSTEDSDEYIETINNQIKQYLKIKDGVVIKEGTWEGSTNIPPAEVLTAANNNPPIVRLSFESKIDTDFYILLSGFTDKAVIKGVTNIENQTETQSPQSGDFLGPVVFPWANKIIFTLSSRQDEIIKSNTLDDIKAGIGIDIDRNDDGSITINNSAPNWDSAAYKKANNADLHTDGYYSLYCFNGWKSGVKNLSSMVEEPGKSIGFNTVLKNCDDLPIYLNTGYDGNGKLISFSIKLPNYMRYNVTTNIDAVSGEKLDNPITVSGVFGRLVNSDIINILNYQWSEDDFIRPDKYTNKGIGIKLLHARELTPDTVFSNPTGNDLDSHTNPNNIYYAYQSVIMAIQFKDYGSNLDSDNKKKATDIRKMLESYAQTSSLYTLSTTMGSNILNISTAIFSAGENYNTYGAVYNEKTNTYSRNDSLPLGAYTSSSENTTYYEYSNTKIFGGSWSISYGFKVLTSDDIETASNEYQSLSSSDKDYSFYKQIICNGTNKQVLYPGAILLVAYSTDDGYNSQMYTLARYLNSNNTVTPSGDNSSPSTRVISTGQNLTATFSLTKI